MLNGPELGAAVAEAIRLKGVTKAAVARHFGIKGPSIYDWINHGRVGKQHLTELVDYFSDVVGPEHWGMDKGFGHSSSHAQRLSAPIILRAIQLMREATRKLEGQPVDVEADPELFAAMLQLAILEPKEDASDGERVRAASGPGGRAVGATSETEDGAAARAAPGRARKRA